MFLFLEQQAADSALRMSSVAPTQCMPYLSDMWQALGMYLARAPALGVRRDVSSRGPKVHVARARVVRLAKYSNSAHVRIMRSALRNRLISQCAV